MFGPDQLYRAAIHVEMGQCVLPQTAHFNEYGVEHKGVMDGREDEPIELGH